MSKIYRVKHTIAGTFGDGMPANVHAERYVRANNRQSAVNFVARDTLVANLATQDELVSAITAGVKIEDASSPQLDMLDDTLKQDKPITATEILANRAAAGHPAVEEYP